jgi:hypothetical protein
MVFDGAKANKQVEKDGETDGGKAQHVNGIT